MNVRERLKEAYENVSHISDTTWCETPDAYRNSNLGLYFTEQYLQFRKQQENRPRTVRECIPRSRLAQYANFVYNESREMSYASNSANFDTNLTIQFPTEPWELPEVTDLYKWFLKNQLGETSFRFGKKYESPLLSVNGFEDKILKIQLTEDRVKNIWNKDSEATNQTKMGQMMVKLYLSPLRNAFLSAQENYNREWFRHLTVSRDFEQIEQLSEKIKSETKSIEEVLSGTVEPSPSSETISAEILYSEVLQGLLPSRKTIPLSKVSSTSFEETTTNDSFTNYTVLNKTVEENKFVAQKEVRNRTPYVQQTFFYAPTVQRWVPSYCPISCVETPVEERPVSSSISEELEIQALEQYNNSDESFYQELERQAAEQYSNFPD